MSQTRKSRVNLHTSPATAVTAPLWAMWTAAEFITTSESTGYLLSTPPDPSCQYALSYSITFLPTSRSRQCSESIVSHAFPAPSILTCFSFSNVHAHGTRHISFVLLYRFNSAHFTASQGVSYNASTFKRTFPVGIPQTSSSGYRDEVFFPVCFWFEVDLIGPIEFKLEIFRTRTSKSPGSLGAPLSHVLQTHAPRSPF